MPKQKLWLFYQTVASRWKEHITSLYTMYITCLENIWETVERTKNVSVKENKTWVGGHDSMRTAIIWEKKKKKVYTTRCSPENRA